MPRYGWASVRSGTIARVSRGRDMSLLIVVVGSVVWAAIALVIGLVTFGDVNPDARLLVGSAIVLSVGAALGASWWATRQRFGWAAGALLISVVAPTYSFWIINVIPIALAAVSIVAVVRDRDGVAAPK